MKDFLRPTHTSLSYETVWKGLKTIITNISFSSAWLWPYAETIRKCARSWVSTVELMKQYPAYTFTCSQVNYSCSNIVTKSY